VRAHGSGCGLPPPWADWWTLLIVRDAFLGVHRFAEFEARLGIAKNVLSDRLQRLVVCEIFEKRPLDASGHRNEYRLTPKGRDLWTVLTALRLWSDKWVYGRGREPYLALDRDTGRAVTALRAIGEDGAAVDPLRMHVGQTSGVFFCPHPRPIRGLPSSRAGLPFDRWQSPPIGASALLRAGLRFAPFFRFRPAPWSASTNFRRAWAQQPTCTTPASRPRAR